MRSVPPPRPRRFGAGTFLALCALLVALFFLLSPFEPVRSLVTPPEARTVAALLSVTPLPSWTIVPSAEPVPTGTPTLSPIAIEPSPLPPTPSPAPILVGGQIVAQPLLNELQRIAVSCKQPQPTDTFAFGWECIYRNSGTDAAITLLSNDQSSVALVSAELTRRDAHSVAPDVRVFLATLATLPLPEGDRPAVAEWVNSILDALQQDPAPSRRTFSGLSYQIYALPDRIVLAIDNGTLSPLHPARPNGPPTDLPTDSPLPSETPIPTDIIYPTDLPYTDETPYTAPPVDPIGTSEPDLPSPVIPTDTPVVPTETPVELF